MTPRAILVIAALFIVLYGYPGLMTADSVDQLDMMRRWDLGDWHPPMLALIWRIVELVVAGPFGMLLIQTTAFVAGCFAVLHHELAPRRAALVTLAICVLPPVVTTMGMVWKDCQMAGYLILGIAALLSDRRRIRWLGLGLLFLASGMRHNTAAATLVPLLVLWAPGLPRWRRLACAVVAWLGITVAALAFNAALTSRSEHPFTRSVAPMDIAGTIRWAPPLTDAELKTLLAGAPLRVDHEIQAAFVARYNPVNQNVYASSDPVLPLPVQDSEDEAVMRAWREIVTAYPAAYLHHRSVVFARLVRLGDWNRIPVNTTFTYDRDPELAQRLHHDASPSTIQRGLFAFERWLASHLYVGLLWAPCVYLAVACILLVGARRSRLVVALLGSGLVYEASFFIGSPAEDYRYSHWMIVTTLLGMAIVFAQRWRQAPANRRA